MMGFWEIYCRSPFVSFSLISMFLSFFKSSIAAHSSFERLLFGAFCKSRKFKLLRESRFWSNILSVFLGGLNTDCFCCCCFCFHNFGRHHVPLVWLWSFSERSPSIVSSVVSFFLNLILDIYVVVSLFYFCCQFLVCIQSSSFLWTIFFFF